MKKISLILIVLALVLWASWFVFDKLKTNSDVEEIISSSWISEEDKKSLKEDLQENTIDKQKIDNKIEALKKKIKLKWLISKADMYFDENEYMIALVEYQKILKDLPNDEEINVKTWDIYYKIHKYKKANEHYQKVKNSRFLDKDKAIFSLINDYWVNKENIEKIKSQIEEFKLSDEKNFYYINSITCIVDYSLCRDKFQKYFEKNKKFETEEMKVMYEAFENFKNFKNDDLYYKAAFVTGAFYQNWFYYVALKTAEWILSQKSNYKPIMKVAAKSAYEIWDYISAKKYLTEVKNIDKDDPEISYFLARVYEKLNDKILALVNYKKALTDWYKDQLDIKRRIIFLFYEKNDTKKMLQAFDELLATKSKDLNLQDYSLAIYYNILNDDLDKATKYSREWIIKFRDSEIFYWYLSWIILQKENITQADLNLVKINLDRAMKINDKSPMILMVSGMYELKRKNYDKAISDLKLAHWLDKSWEYKDVINTWLENVNNEKNNENSIN